MKKRVTFAAIFLLLAAETGIVSASDEGIGLSDVFRYLVVGPIVRGIFIYGVMLPWMYKYGTSFSNNFDGIILMNPSVVDQKAPLYNNALAELMGLPIRLLTPVYELAILAVAFYMIFLPASSAGRAGAKNLLARLIVSMIFFSASPLIFETLLQVSYNLSKAIMTQQAVDNARDVFVGGIWAGYWLFARIGMTDLELAIPFWGSLYAMSWLPYIIILVRYIMVTLLGLVFPVGILLYSFSFLRGLGRKILEQSLVWIFMQVFLASAIATIALGTSFYDAVLPGNNAIISGINVIPVPDLRDLTGLFNPAIESPDELHTGLVLTASTPMHTSIIAYTLGAAAYGLIFAVPLMMVRLLGHFLP